MDADAVIGCAVIAASLGALVTLVLWSRRRIERIARMAGRSARRIVRDLRDGG
jgi:hypothetical protein